MGVLRIRVNAPYPSHDVKLVMFLLPISGTSSSSFLVSPPRARLGNKPVFIAMAIMCSHSSLDRNSGISENTEQFILSPNGTTEYGATWYTQNLYCEN